MKRYTVRLFGLPHEATKLPEVEVELEDGANLGDIIAALRSAIPTLKGNVIHAGEDRLLENYGFNINGRFYLNDEEIQLKDCDYIALLSLATGG